MSVLLWASLRGSARAVLLLLVVQLAVVGLFVAALPSSIGSSGDIPLVSIAVVMPDDDEGLTRNVEDQLADVGMIDELHFCSEDEGLRLLQTGAVDAVVTIPPGLRDALWYQTPVTVTVTASDPLTGQIVLNAVSQSAGLLDSVQGYFLTYVDAAEASGLTSEQSDRAIFGFQRELLSEALGRTDLVSTPGNTPVYLTQAATLTMVLIAAVAAVFAAMTCARRYDEGFVRHLRMRRIGYPAFAAVHLALAGILALLPALIVSLAAGLVGLRVNLLVFVAGTVFTAMILAALFNLLAGIRYGQMASAPRVVLGSVVLLFLMLFLGGGFYPSALMASPIMVLNPVWTAQSLANGSLGGPFDSLSLLSALLLAAICLAAGYWEFRRAGR